MNNITTHWLSESQYTTVWHKMQQFTKDRTAQTNDQIWLTQHTPVYTMGRAASTDHILNNNQIPVVHTDRGGQVTYHGPGQLMVYCLFDLRRYSIFVKEYVQLLEDVVIDFLSEHKIKTQKIPGAPGVYVPSDSSITPYLKIASLGIKVSSGCAYHGLALNIDMDLKPFHDINPCGLTNIGVTDMRTLNADITLEQAGNDISSRLIKSIVQNAITKAKSNDFRDKNH